jgi:ABC-type multidrug transport system permease subunit
MISTKSQIPPYPTFPKWCFILIMVCIGTIVISLITMFIQGKNQSTNEENEENDGRTVSLGGDPGSLGPNAKPISNIFPIFLLIAVVCLIAFGSSCGMWYNFEKHKWVFTYGTPAEKTALIAQDTISAVSQGLSNLTRRN